MSIKNKLKTAAAAGLVAVMAGCGGMPKRDYVKPSPGVPIDKCEGLPIWYGKQNVEGFLYGYGQASSLDIGTAERNANDYARIDLAQRIETYVERIKVGLEKETGISSNSLQEIITVRFLYGAGANSDIDVCEKDEMYNVRIGIGAPIGATADSILSQINRNQQYGRILQETETYKNLKSELERFKEDYNQLKNQLYGNP